MNTDDSFVTKSPYIHVFDDLEQVHHEINADGLTAAMKNIGYRLTDESEQVLPDGKKLLKLDFEYCCL